MIEFRFEWDEAKNRANQRKHGLSFEEASHVFRDPLHVSMQDRIEGGERRWRTLGTVGGFAVLLVAHTLAEEESSGAWREIVRIISARRPTPSERRRYEEQNR